MIDKFKNRFLKVPITLGNGIILVFKDIGYQITGRPWNSSKKIVILADVLSAMIKLF
jgi:hypothetical protein